MARLIVGLPIIAAVFLALLLTAGTSLMLLEQFRPPLAFAIAAVLTIPAMRIVGLGDRQVARNALVVDVLALLLAVSFGGINAGLASQNVVIGRDPGVYAVGSQWLVHHTSTDVDTQTSLFGTTRALTAGSNGIGQRDEKDHVYLQGSHGLPEVLSVVGSFFGTRVMFGANAVLGGLALLLVYAFGRLVVGRWGALVAAGLLGASLPQLAFSRDTYTEPLSQLLLFGGLTLLLTAKPGRSGHWLLAGLVIAGGCLARIDSFLVLPPVIAYAGIRLAVTAPDERRVALRDTGALLLGMVPPAVLGYLDLKLASPGYLLTLTSQFRQIEILIVLALLGGAALVLVGWKTPLVQRLATLREVTRARLGVVTGAAVVTVGVALAVRPLLYTARGLDDPGKAAFLGSLQKIEGTAIDGDRTYAEQTVTWISWYLGPVTVALGFLGLAYLLGRAVRRGDLTLVPFFLVFALTGLVYLVQPSITPDQIWAMRRYVPIVLPGLALAAMLVVGRILTWLRAHQPRLVVPAAVVLLALLALPIARTTRPLALTAEGKPQLAELASVCTALPADAAVLSLGRLTKSYPMSLRTFCDVPSSYVNGPPATTAELGAIAVALKKSGHSLWIVGDQDAFTTGVPIVGVPPKALNSVQVTLWERTLSHPPRAKRIISRDVFVGLVGTDGRVVRWAHR